ncbi:MAG: amidohydrolase family protein [Lentisphaerae bacterium]|nr:amidohydrolase family protein [Lentisphaerota bacterium]
MKTAIWEKPGSIAEAYWKHGHADFPVYDMHGHMGCHYAIYFKRCEPADVVAHLKRAGVQRLVFSHHEALWGALRNEKVWEMCRQFPEHLRMYVSINPHFPENIKEDLAKFDQWAPYAVGLKFLADYHRVAVTDKAYEYALKFAEERALPILNHTWGGSACNGGPIMLEVAQKYPRIKFFMGHSIYGDWEYARRVVKETAGNVWLELTAIPGERGTIEKLVEMVGSERLLYGTDLPWFDEFQGIGGVLSAKITEDDMRNILYRNVERIFGKNW